MQDLFASFGNMAQLSPEASQALIDSLNRREVPKNTLLCKLGDICSNLYFVEQGITRSFYYKEGKEVTFWIAAENDFVGSLTSYFSQSPSRKSVETLEDSILWEFNYHSLEALYESSKELERMGRLFSNYALTLLETRFDNLQFMTAKERYEALLQRQPAILQRVSLGIVASYLGITQETLSRIRAQS